MTQSDDSEDVERRSRVIEIDPRLIGVASFRQPPSTKKNSSPISIKRRSRKTKVKRFQGGKPEGSSKDMSWESNFICLKCNQEVKYSREFVKNHLRKHR